MQRERVNISLDIGFTIYWLGKDLPCIALVSGVTKNDGCGVVVLRRVVEELKDRALHGTVVVVPQLNEYGLSFRPCFNGKDEPLCKVIDKLIDIVPRQCPVVEIRCRKGFIPHVIMPKSYEDKDFRTLVEAIPAEPVVKANIKSLANIIRKKGHSSLTLVLSGGKDFSYSEVERGVELVLDLLSNLRFLKRKSKSVQHIYSNGYFLIKCDSKGVFIPSISSGSKIAAKTIIGKLDDSEISSPISGLVLYIASPRLCDVNEIVCVVASED